jgi:hypothetical protein
MSGYKRPQLPPGFVIPEGTSPYLCDVTMRFPVLLDGRPANADVPQSSILCLYPGYAQEGVVEFVKANFRCPPYITPAGEGRVTHFSLTPYEPETAS